MAVKLVWRFINTVSKEGPDVYRMVSSAAIESADKNAVIDRVESLGWVDEDNCTVLSFINGGYDIV